MGKRSHIMADATALHQQGAFDQAIALYRTALKRNPRHAALHYNLGSALQSMGDHRGAAQAFAKASEIEPDNDKFRARWSANLRQCGREEESLELWRKAIARRPGEAEPRIQYAKCLVALRRIEDALSAYRQALDIDAANADVMAESGRLLQRLGRYDEARTMAERALASQPGHGDAVVLLARIKVRAGETDSARRLLEDVMRCTNDAMARGRASLELASILERCGEYEHVFEIVEQGQAALFSRLSPAERDLRPAYLVDQLCKQHITADVVAGWSVPPADGRRDPIFIVGFPRTGTTLLEQMLSAHSHLVVTDELPLIQRVKDATTDRLGLRQQYPQSLSVLGPRQLSVLRDTYFDSARRMIGEAALNRRIVDKSPLNTTDLCVVRRIFPEARVIVALRDPRDTVLSSFFQAFARATPHFYGFESTAQLYAVTMDLWMHYRSVLGLKWMEVRYEDVVVDPERWARAMIEFVGEPWEDAVLNYHGQAHRRYVTTPSFEDVAKPVYATAMRRWERYRAHFERVRPMLEPFVREFGYGAW